MPSCVATALLRGERGKFGEELVVLLEADFGAAEKRFGLQYGIRRPYRKIINVPAGYTNTSSVSIARRRFRRAPVTLTAGAPETPPAAWATFSFELPPGYLFCISVWVRKRKW